MTGPRELLDAKIRFVSLVERGANAEPFRIIKSAGAEEGIDLESFAKQDDPPVAAPAPAVLSPTDAAVTLKNVVTLTKASNDLSSRVSRAGKAAAAKARAIRDLAAMDRGAKGFASKRNVKAGYAALGRNLNSKNPSAAEMNSVAARLRQQAGPRTSKVIGAVNNARVRAASVRQAAEFGKRNSGAPKFSARTPEGAAMRAGQVAGRAEASAKRFAGRARNAAVEAGKTARSVRDFSSLDRSLRANPSMRNLNSASDAILRRGGGGVPDSPVRNVARMTSGAVRVANDPRVGPKTRRVVGAVNQARANASGAKRVFVEGYSRMVNGRSVKVPGFWRVLGGLIR